MGSKQIELQNERERLQDLEQNISQQYHSLNTHSQMLLSKSEELAFKDKQIAQNN